MTILYVQGALNLRHIYLIARPEALLEPGGLILTIANRLREQIESECAALIDNVPIVG